MRCNAMSRHSIIHIFRAPCCCYRTITRIALRDADRMGKLGRNWRARARVRARTWLLKRTNARPPKSDTQRQDNATITVFFAPNQSHCRLLIFKSDAMNHSIYLPYSAASRGTKHFGNYVPLPPRRQQTGVGCNTSGTYRIDTEKNDFISCIEHCN